MSKFDAMSKNIKKEDETKDDYDSGFLSSQSNYKENDTSTDNLGKKQKNVSVQQDSGFAESDNMLMQSSELIKKFGNLDLHNNKKGNSKKNELWEIYYKQNNEGETLLHLACLFSESKYAENIVRIAPHKILLNIPNDFGQTALHYAVFNNNSNAIKILLNSGADVYAQDLDGNTPFHLACIYNHLECLKALVNGIGPQNLANAKVVKKIIALRNYDGEECIHLAAKENNTEILQYLLTNGADINSREGKCGLTILHISILKNNVNVINFLLKEGDKYNINVATKTYGGETAHRFATFSTNDLLKQIITPSTDDSDDDDNDSGSESC